MVSAGERIRDRETDTMDSTAERAGIWLRVSTGQQNEQSQLPDIDRWTAGHGYGEPARTYTLHGLSAHKGNRKFDRAWSQVLADIQAGVITVLVVWKLDRIDRKLETFKRIAEVVAAGGRIEFVTEPHLNDLSTMAGRIALKIAEEMAYQESVTKSDRSRANRAMHRTAGVLDGRPPWGYVSSGLKDAKRMVATAEGTKYVPEVFQRVADGGEDGKLAAVASWLSGVTGRSVHPRTIAEMIRNPAYRGEYRARIYERALDENGQECRGPWTGEYGRTVHQCPELVTGDLWRRANANLAARPSNRRGQRVDLDTRQAGAALLSGHAYCGNPACDATGDEPSPMCKSGAFYRCTGRGRARKGCGTMVPITAADALLDREMSALRRPVMRPVFHPATGHQIELEDVAQALRDLPARGLDEDAEDAERAALRAERKRLAALPATPAHTTYEPAGQTYGQKWAASDAAERRAWLRDAGFALYLSRPDQDVEDNDEPGDALSRVDVYEDDRAVITFRWTGDSDAGLARGTVAA